MKTSAMTSLPFVPTALFVLCSSIAVLANRLPARSRFAAASMAGMALVVMLVR